MIKENRKVTFLRDKNSLTIEEFSFENYLFDYDYDYFVEFSQFIKKELYIRKLAKSIILSNNVEPLLKHYKAGHLYGVLSTSKFITPEFIESNIDMINWYNLSCNCIHNTAHIDKNIIYKYIKFLDASLICGNVELDEEFIYNNEHMIDFGALSCNRQTFTNEFYDKYHNKLDWEKLTVYSRLKDDVIFKYINKITISNIIRNQVVSERFIEKYLGRFSWFELISSCNVSESILLKYVNRLNRRCIQRILMSRKYNNYILLFDAIGWKKIVYNYDLSHSFKMDNASKIFSVQKENNNL